GIGYLATSQCFHDGTDVLMLTTNMIGKDLNSSSMNEAGIAMSGLSCFINSDLARDLANDIMTLFGASTSLELRLGKKLIEQLTNLIHSTSAMSLLYECINTVIAVKYLGVLVMSKILYTHSKSVQVHSDLIMRCLGDKDESIRLRALDLLSEMVRK
ncbi:unnamed protein product, partial [Rotaria sordida]